MGLRNIFMSKINSIFHRLQKEGPQNLMVVGHRNGFHLNLGLFFQKLRPFPSDPLPIFRISITDMQKVMNRYYQIMAAKGTKIDPAFLDSLEANERQEKQDLFLYL